MREIKHVRINNIYFVKFPETSFTELLLIENENENHLKQMCKENFTPWGLYFDGLSVDFVQPLIVLL